MKNNKGISLAELSIVLAIIGLLLAAVTEGMSIRKSSEMQSFLSDIRVFQNAIEGFDSKYRNFPGDMPNAWTYWDNGANTICGTATQCNGDGDGFIDRGPGSGVGVAEAAPSSATDVEAYRAWQHLVLAEFLEGGHTGVAGAGNKQADIGISVPASKRTKVGYGLSYSNTGGGLRNEINIGSFFASDFNTYAALTPQEALAIDKKLDDSIPGTGLVHGVDGSDVAATNCVLAGVYNNAITSPACIQTFPVKP